MYGPRQVFIPKMTALGLLLEYPIFESYSKRIAGVNDKVQPSDPEYRPAIDFEVHRAQLDDFKQHHSACESYSGVSVRKAAHS